MADTVQSEILDSDKPNTRALLRFFSVESNMNVTENINELSEFAYHFYSKEFMLKIAQLLMGIICAGLYSEGVKVVTDSVTSETFPFVVISSFIIITSVIVLGYMLGHVMPDLLIRVFNAIGMILYFISATVTLHTWFAKSASDMRLPLKLLFVHAIVSYVSSVLYGLDMFFSLKKSLLLEA